MVGAPRFLGELRGGDLVEDHNLGDSVGQAAVVGANVNPHLRRDGIGGVPGWHLDRWEGRRGKGEGWGQSREPAQD